MTVSNFGRVMYLAWPDLGPCRALLSGAMPALAALRHGQAQLSRRLRRPAGTSQSGGPSIHWQLGFLGPGSAGILRARLGPQLPCCGPRRWRLISDHWHTTILTRPARPALLPVTRRAAKIGRAYNHSRHGAASGSRTDPPDTLNGAAELRRSHCHSWIPGFRCNG